MAAFLRYLGIKRRNAVWGDDPEVQALSEIYDRPAEIWAYDPQVIKRKKKKSENYEKGRSLADRRNMRGKKKRKNKKQKKTFA